MAVLVARGAAAVADDDGVLRRAVRALAHAAHRRLGHAPVRRARRPAPARRQYLITVVAVAIAVAVAAVGIIVFVVVSAVVGGGRHV